MDRICLYEIRVEGQLSDQWIDWFDGLIIHARSKGVTVLRGSLPDQAALFGVLTKIHTLNLTLILVKRIPFPKQERKAVR